MSDLWYKSDTKKGKEQCTIDRAIIYVYCCISFVFLNIDVHLRQVALQLGVEFVIAVPIKGQFVSDLIQKGKEQCTR